MRGLTVIKQYSTQKAEEVTLETYTIMNTPYMNTLKYVWFHTAIRKCMNSNKHKPVTLN